MKLHSLFAITLTLIQFPVVASNVNFQMDFGIIIHNDNGEPIGFERTQTIPINNNGKPSLYGLVVTSPEEDQFMLSSVHQLPEVNNNDTHNKIMGKPMLIQKRGAILLRTEQTDAPGQYKMEVYIDNKLHHTISYELVDNTQLTKL